MRSLILAVLVSIATIPAIAQDSDKPAQEATEAAKAEKEYEPPPGYKTRHRGNKTIYCRKAAEIGSRFPVEKCFSEEQLEIELQRIEAVKEDLERRRRICADQSLCGSS